MEKRDIKSMLPAELETVMRELGQPRFRAGQIFKWLHSGVTDFAKMSNLPKDLRENLDKNFYIADVILKKRLESTLDDTVKYLYMLADGEYIESVLMKYRHGYTVCVSTQVGCRMAVSYTHLDVYKRQTATWGCWSLSRRSGRRRKRGPTGCWSG